MVVIVNCFISHIVNLLVFRELLQNSDDAGCDTAEIHFETADFLALNTEAVGNIGLPTLPNLETTNVRNHLSLTSYILLLFH